MVPRAHEGHRTEGCGRILVPAIGTARVVVVVVCKAGALYVAVLGADALRHKPPRHLQCGLDLLLKAFSIS